MLRSRTRSLVRFFGCCAVGLGLMVAAHSGTQAQVLWQLSASSTQVNLNDLVTITLQVVNQGAAAVNNLAAYDTNIGISPTYLTFVNNGSGKPFTSSFSGFDTEFLNTSTSNNLRVAYGALANPVVNLAGNSTTVLGTFQVRVNTLPSVSTAVTPGNPGSALTGGSELDNTSGANVLTGVSGVTLTPVPTPASWLALLGGQGLFWGLLRRKKTA